MSASLVPPELLLDPDIVYLNTAALGPTPRSVFDRVSDAWRDLVAVPAQSEQHREALYRAVDQARTNVGTLLGCRADEVLLTQSTTDSMNKIAQCIRLHAGDRVLTTNLEHFGGSACWQYRARRDGIEIDRIDLALDEHDPEAIVARFAAALRPRTRVVSVSHVIAATGLRMPIEQISTLARTHNVICVVDGAQAVGQVPVDVKQLGCHAYAASGHKWLLGPKGTGILYMSQALDDSMANDTITPIEWEGGRSLQVNTTAAGNPPLAIGLGAAIDIALANDVRAIGACNLELRNRAYEALQKMRLVRLLGAPPGALATSILAVQITAGKLNGEQLATALRQRHRIVVKPVEPMWFNGIRIAPHYFNSMRQLQVLTDAIADALA